MAVEYAGTKEAFAARKDYCLFGGSYNGPWHLQIFQVHRVYLYFDSCKNLWRSRGFSNGVLANAHLWKGGL